MRTMGRWMRERPCACAEEVAMAVPNEPQAETYNPWSIVNLVFHHLADQGLHPTLGESGDPGEPAAALLSALGIEPAAEGNRQVMAAVRLHLDQIRTAVLGEPGDG
jgi:hypothetical protein